MTSARLTAYRPALIVLHRFHCETCKSVSTYLGSQSSSPSSAIFLIASNDFDTAIFAPFLCSSINFICSSEPSATSGCLHSNVYAESKPVSHSKQLSSTTAKKDQTHTHQHRPFPLPIRNRIRNHRSIRLMEIHLDRPIALTHLFHTLPIRRFKPHFPRNLTPFFLLALLLPVVVVVLLLLLLVKDFTPLNHRHKSLRFSDFNL